MSKRRSTGLVVAIALGMAAALGAMAGERAQPPAVPAVQLAMTHHGNGLSLSVTFAGVVVTLKI